MSNLASFHLKYSYICFSFHFCYILFIVFLLFLMLLLLLFAAAIWVFFFAFRCTRRDLLLILFTNPSAQAGYDTRSIFKRSLTGLNSELSFSENSCLTKAEEPSLSYYLPIAGGRIIGFIPFPRVLMLCEMQSASSRI